jgi:hypothetical protein
VILKPRHRITTPRCICVATIMRYADMDTCCVLTGQSVVVWSGFYNKRKPSPWPSCDLRCGDLLCRFAMPPRARCVCVCGFLSFCIDHTKWLYFVATGESEARAYESRSDAGAGSSKESFGEELYRSNKHEQDHFLPPGDLRNALAPGERGSCSVQSTTMGAFLPLL